MRKTITKVQTVIGIDPDVEKNGVASLECDTRRLEIATLTFPDLLDYLMWAKRRAETTGRTFRVIIEAGWLNKSNWHLAPKDTRAVAAAKGNHAGRNHEQEELAAFTGITGRTNQEGRDAALLAWTWAGFSLNRRGNK